MVSPSKSANQLLDELGWTQPSDISIEEIAWYLGLIVKSKKIDGAQGRILMNNHEGVIAVNDSITYKPKVNFIIAHEIGHSRLHRHLQPVFSDSDRTLSEWYISGPQEAEANQFATELLMPPQHFIKKVQQQRLSLSLIEEVAEYFGASKTAAFLRYRDLGQYPVMIIFIENGHIKWRSHSKDFPLTWIEQNAKVPAWTVAGDLFYKQVKEEKPAKVDASEWFPTDYRIKYNTNLKLWEQCFSVTENAILTCLWTA